MKPVYFNHTFNEAQIATLAGALHIAIDRYREHLVEIPTLNVSDTHKAGLTAIFTENLSSARSMLERLVG